MTVRPDAVRQRLCASKKSSRNLATVPTAPANPWFDDFRDAWAAERGLQLGAEIVFDIGNHILTAAYGVNAENYEDIVLQLLARGVIDADVHGRLEGLGGLRNILVHGYLRIDPARVADYLRRAPDDFTAFAVAVRSWLASQAT